MSNGYTYAGNLRIKDGDGNPGPDFKLATKEYKALHKKIIASVYMRMAAGGFWTLITAILFLASASSQKPEFQGLAALIFLIFTIGFILFEVILYRHQRVIMDAFFSLKERLGIEGRDGTIARSTWFAFHISFAGLMTVYGLFFLATLAAVMLAPKPSKDAQAPSAFSVNELPDGTFEFHGRVSKEMMEQMRRMMGGEMMGQWPRHNEWQGGPPNMPDGGRGNGMPGQQQPQGGQGGPGQPPQGYQGGPPHQGGQGGPGQQGPGGNPPQGGPPPQGGQGDPGQPPQGGPGMPGGPPPPQGGQGGPGQPPQGGNPPNGMMPPPGGQGGGGQFPPPGGQGPH